MKCQALCSADSYQVNLLYEFLKQKNYNPQKFRNVIYSPFYDGDVFFFSYGCVVFWGVEDQNIEVILEEIKDFGIGNINNACTNSDSYYVVKDSINKVHLNEIRLNEQAAVMEKLAISHALAQSMKLSVFEERVEKTIKTTEHIPRSLAKTGKITLSGQEIAKKMGELFLERSSINLNSDILDTPEFFWDFPEMEPIYQMAIKNQDVHQRLDILNKRLNLIHELFEILGDLFNNRHSSFLEIVIIILIGMEIILTITFELFK